MATWGSGLSLRGAKGDAGLSVLTSSGAPTVTGYEGQAAIDTTAGDLYKYTGGAWVKQVSLVGKMGLNGLNAQLLYGSNPPTTSTFNNQSDAIYFQYSGELWFFDFEGNKTWTDSGQNLTGPQGAPGVGKDGLRGTQTYSGHGAPSNTLSSFSPPAAAGDVYYDLDGGPAIYFLS